MDRDKKYIDYLYRWIRLGQSGITIEQLFYDRGLRKIAVYGFDRLSRCLLYELADSSIQIQGVIDKRGSQITWVDWPMYALDDLKQLEADAIVLCPVASYEVIKKDLEKYTDIRLITFEELIYEL